MGVNAKHTVSCWLKQLPGADTSFELDNNGQCCLIAEEARCVVYVPTDDSARFCLYTSVGRVFEPLSWQISEQIFGLNLLGADTNGGVIGYNANEKNFVFSYQQEIACTDSASFASAVSNFVHKAKEVEGRISDLINLAADTDEKNPGTTSPQTSYQQQFSL